MTAAGGCHSIDPASESRIRRSYPAPVRTVPVLSLPIIPNRPHVICGNGDHHVRDLACSLDGAEKIFVAEPGDHRPILLGVAQASTFPKETIPKRTPITSTTTGCRTLARSIPAHTGKILFYRGLSRVSKKARL